MIRKDIELHIGQSLTLDLALELGSVEQTVEVSAAAPLVESGTSDLSTVVEAPPLRDLPVAVAATCATLNPSQYSPLVSTWPAIW